MSKTNIEWADRVWNPMTGCTKVSSGCKNCYAERMAKRLRGRCGYPADDPFRVTLHEERLKEPLKWREPSRVFVCSMGDLFHKYVPLSFTALVWQIMERCPQHTFLILAKRPALMKDALEYKRIFPALPNVWLGVSVEDQATADERIPLLLQTPAAKRFVSYEPALGPVDFTGWFGRKIHKTVEEREMDAPTGDHNPYYREGGLDWLIMGGESGPGARPMHPDWARSARDQCVKAGVPFFFKQYGEWAPRTFDEVIEHEGLNVKKYGGFNDKHEWVLSSSYAGECYGKLDIGITQIMGRVGKKAAGAVLDGREWREVPE